MLSETAGVVRVDVFSHFGDFSLGGVHAEATDDRAQVRCCYISVGILVKQSKNFSDLGDRYFV